MAEPSFDFKKFITDSRQILIKPAEYFKKMEKSGGVEYPIIRALIYVVTAEIITFLWIILKLQSGGGISVSLPESIIEIILLIITMIASVILLFIGGIIVLTISALCGGITDFEASIRVTASLMIVIPLSAVIGVISGFSLYTGFIIFILIPLYSIFLMYNSITHALNGKRVVTRIVAIILSAFPVLLFMGTLKCMEKVKTMSKEMERLPESNREMKEKFDKLKELMKNDDEKKQM